MHDELDIEMYRKLYIHECYVHILASCEIKRHHNSLLSVVCFSVTLNYDDLALINRAGGLDRGGEYGPKAVRSVHTTEVKILPYRPMFI